MAVRLCMFSPVTFISLSFFLPAGLLIAVFLISRNRKVTSNAASYVACALCAVVGVFFLVLTCSLFLEGKAILPLKNASSFTKQENPNAFFFFTALNISIGILFLLFSVRNAIKAVRPPTSESKHDV